MASNKRSIEVATSYSDQEIIAEMVFDRVQKRSLFCVSAQQGIAFTAQLTVSGSKTLQPYAPQHPFVVNQVVLFPESPLPYEDVETLIHAIQRYIHTYVDLSEIFEIIATHYVLLTWLYDTYSVLGYLRMKGDFGTGKTRFLIIMGSICYKPIFASGAATVAPLFHILNDIGGTLIMDESDFYQSSEMSLIAKILNNGNAMGFPVLRCEKTAKQTFTTRAYTVYGPKILAARGTFEDAALESRFLSENAGVRPLRMDVPLRLPKAQQEEALDLRNKLLLFRFDHYREDQVFDDERCSRLSPRMQQVVSPLLRFMNTTEQEKVIAWAKQQEAQQLRDRGMELPAHVVSALRDLLKTQSFVEMGHIRKGIMREYGDHYEYPITAKAIGTIVRSTLNLTTKRHHGRYGIPDSEKDKIALLATRYGL